MHAQQANKHCGDFFVILTKSIRMSARWVCIYPVRIRYVINIIAISIIAPYFTVILDLYILPVACLFTVSERIYLADCWRYKTFEQEESLFQVILLEKCWKSIQTPSFTEKRTLTEWWICTMCKSKNKQTLFHIHGRYSSEFVVDLLLIFLLGLNLSSRKPALWNFQLEH